MVRPKPAGRKRALHFFILGFVSLPTLLLAQNTLPKTANPNPSTVYNFATALQDAMANDPRLAAADQALTSQATNQAITKMSAMPQLTASGYVGSYNQNRFQQIPHFYTLFGQRYPFGTEAGNVTVSGTSGTLRKVNLTASQNILTFGRQEANQAISDSQYRLAQWQQKKIRYQITTEVANNYIDCATAAAITKTREFYLASLQSIYNDVKKKYDLDTATNTDLNLARIDYRNAANDLLLQQQQVKTSCEKLLRLTAQDITYQQLLPRLSLADLEQYDKLIPDNFDEIKNTALTNNPDLGTAVESLTLSQKRKEQAVANSMPLASWNARIEQLTVPGSVSRNGANDSSTINNRSLTLALNYQENILQNIFTLSASDHNAKSQLYLAANQLQTTVNLLLELWQNYQVNKKSLPLMVQSLHELEQSVSDVENLYDRGGVRLATLLQRRQEFFENLIQYHQLHKNYLITSITLLALLRNLS